MVWHNIVRSLYSVSILHYPSFLYGPQHYSMGSIVFLDGCAQWEETTEVSPTIIGDMLSTFVSSCSPSSPTQLGGNNLGKLNALLWSLPVFVMILITEVTQKQKIIELICLETWLKSRSCKRSGTFLYPYFFGWLEKWVDYSQLDKKYVDIPIVFHTRCPRKPLSQKTFFMGQGTPCI